MGVFGNGVTVAAVERDDKYVAARVGIHVYSCYASPNQPDTQFAALLQRLESSIRAVGTAAKIIVAGDFNARSAAWGDWVTDPRGDGLVSLVDTLSLIVVNEGAEPTFIGRGAGSIVDVTMAFESLSHTICGWRVRSELDNHSDHHAIEYVTTACTLLARQPTSQRPRGWNTAKGIDLEAFKTGYSLANWGRAEEEPPVDPAGRSKW